jgi:hypothetical protein
MAAAEASTLLQLVVAVTDPKVHANFDVGGRRLGKTVSCSAPKKFPSKPSGVGQTAVSFVAPVGCTTQTLPS